MNIELLQKVYEDLEYMLKEWNGSIENDAICRSSNVLRGLFVHDLLGRAAREVGFHEMRILAPEVDIAALMGPDDVYYQMGGGESHGHMLAGSTRINGAPDAKQRAEIFEKMSKAGAPGKKKPMKLGAYLKQPSFVINGDPKTIITHSEVVQYVANKLGSTHFDQTRDLEKEIERKFFLLDAIRSTPVPLPFVERNPIYFELLSIAQCVVNSNDVLKLRRQIKVIIADKK